MNEIYAALFSWAVSLSGYSTNIPAPRVALEEHSYFVKQACGGSECTVIGWYPAGGTTVYIDSSLDVEHSTLGASILVHEYVHYLQYASRPETSDRPSCQQFITWEREAYTVQSKFIEAYGDYIPVGFTLMDIQCN